MNPARQSGSPFRFLDLKTQGKLKNPTQALRTTFQRDTAKLNNTYARLVAKSVSGESTEDTVTATGVLDTIRYGHVLQVRRLVGVRGVGKAYDGNYYVKKVTHRIKQGEYKQSFTLPFVRSEAQQ